MDSSPNGSLPLNSEPLLTVVIPTLNRASALESQLTELARQYDGSFQVLVSDNGSNDETPSVVNKWQQRFPVLRYNRFETNQGFDRNIFRAYQLTRTLYLWYCSDNYPIYPGAVAGIVDRLRAYEPTVAAMGVLSEENPEILSAGGERVFRSEAEMPNYDDLFRGVMLSSLVLRRMEIDESRVVHAFGTWFMQLALCQELLRQRFCFAVFPNVFVAKKKVNRHAASRPYLDLWVNSPLRALRVSGGPLKWERIQSWMNGTWRAYFKVLLSARIGLYQLDVTPNVQAFKTAWTLLGVHAVLFYGCNLLAWSMPSSLVRAVYRHRLVRRYGECRGQQLFEERTLSAQRQTTASAW